MADSPPRKAAWDCEVAIVGGGPAGLAAAIGLRERGAGRVLLLEREPEPGGIPRHCGHYPFGLHEFQRLLRGPDYARRLAAQAEASGADIRLECSVVGIEPGPVLKLSTPDGLREVTARRVLLATGVRESSRAARFIGGERPQGVLSTGALQSLVYLDGLRPFEKPVVLGSELVSFSALLTCRHAGIKPVAMVEAESRITARSFARGLPLALGVPLLLGCRLELINGHRRVESVLLRDGRGEARELACDGVIVTGRFLPEATLARMGHLEVDAGSGGPSIDQFGRCSDIDYYAAGNLLRPVETAGWSWREGVEAAERIAADLRGELPREGGVQSRIALSGEGLRYLLPQRLCASDSPLAMQRAQLRVSQPVAGDLSLSAGGRKLWSRRLRALPERRILLPLSTLASRQPGEEVELSLEGGA